MGCSPNTQLCVGCGEPGAAVRLIAADGQVEPGWFCWGCADERATAIPSDDFALRAVLCFLEPAWLRTRAGARWLAGRLERRNVDV